MMSSTNPKSQGSTAVCPGSLGPVQVPGLFWRQMALFSRDTGPGPRDGVPWIPGPRPGVSPRRGDPFGEGAVLLIDHQAVRAGGRLAEALHHLPQPLVGLVDLVEDALELAAIVAVGEDNGGQQGREGNVAQARRVRPRQVAPLAHLAQEPVLDPLARLLEPGGGGVLGSLVLDLERLAEHRGDVVLESDAPERPPLPRVIDAPHLVEIRVVPLLQQVVVRHVPRVDPDALVQDLLERLVAGGEPADPGDIPRVGVDGPFGAHSHRRGRRPRRLLRLGLGLPLLPHLVHRRRLRHGWRLPAEAQRQGGEDVLPRDALELLKVDLGREEGEARKLAVVAVRDADHLQLVALLGLLDIVWLRPLGDVDYHRHTLLLPGIRHGQP
mmetsp:Transcript_49889/g.124501  ORF Transcript_49889/g.124501 Transcript_49889/m.124501 type:complete len:382 (+) Transcript_49889:128-1273(+)